MYFQPIIRWPPQDASSILDWPLPQPSYDEVTTEQEGQSEDQEVWSIYKGQTEETVATPSAATTCRNESQSADLFQELQREVERVYIQYRLSDVNLLLAFDSDQRFWQISLCEL